MLYTGDHEAITALVFCGGYLLVMVSIEYVFRNTSVSSETTRRIHHTLAGFFGLTMAFILSHDVFLICTVLFFVLMLISFTKKYMASIHAVTRKTYGELLFPIGVGAAYIVAGGATREFIASILVLSCSDSLAGWGSMTSLRYYGSLLFFLTTSIILLALYNYTLVVIVLTAFLITALERFSPMGSDNLTIPVGSVLFLIFLSRVGA